MGVCATANPGGSDLVGSSDAMERVRQTIAAVAPRRCPVMIRGESGTGKELVARAIHQQSGRAGELVTVDCTTLRDTLLESQLFGHVRGAFTGADRETLGFIRAAHGGTLFLDEVGELAPPLQAKLLRFLQEATITPLGSVHPVRVDVRVLCATHRDLRALVKEGAFRLDLYYRLNIVQIGVPPLRERMQDLPTIARHLLAGLARDYDEPVKAMAPEAEVALLRHDWPGNVRELANALEHAVILGGPGAITAADLPPSVVTDPDVDDDGPDADVPGSPGRGLPLMSLDDAQRSLVRSALQAADGHQGRAAALLGVERRRLYRMVDRFGLRAMAR